MASSPSSLKRDRLEKEVEHLIASGLMVDALELLSGCLEQYPQSRSFWRSLHVATAASGFEALAESSLSRLLSTLECESDTRKELAQEFLKINEFDWAERHLLACCLKEADWSDGWFLLGRVRIQRWDARGAVDALYRALELRPTEGSWYCSLGNALGLLGKLDACLLAYQEAEKLLGVTAEISLNISQVLHQMRRYEDEVVKLREVVELEPDNAYALSSLIYSERRVCDWSRLPYSETELNLGCDQQSGRLVDPFVMLPVEDNPHAQLSRAKTYFHARFGSFDRVTFKKKFSGLKQLRLGYVGSDFHEHATLYLLEGVFREHDKSIFDVHCVSYDTAVSEDVKTRLKQYGCKFHDFSALSDRDFLEKCRALELDFAIDLKGYTTGSRLACFAKGLAPIQINFLGFPGTTGSSVHDYIIGDNVVTPPGCDLAFSEKIIRLPCCYQPNDHLTRKVGTYVTRSDCGLPEDAVVLCSFNNNYKISPVEFEIWMDVLKSQERAVLWLFADNEKAISNLRREAEKRGVAGTRLIHAPPVAHEDHLARMICADLFLDTFNVNAHTTATDALFVGLPLLTLKGKQFAARVATSILSHLGLHELIAHDLSEYKAKINNFIADESSRAILRKRVIQSVEEMPLFDAKNYTKIFEATLVSVAHQHFGE